MYDATLSDLKEIRSHGTKSFPCAIYRTRSVQKGSLVKHHWHDEAEILYFSGGNFHLEINMEPFTVSSECLYFINPGELHSITIKAANSYEDAVVFSPEILSFDSCDSAQIQLLRPLQQGKLRFPRCIFPEHPAFVPVRNSFADIMHSFGRVFSEESLSDDGAVTDDLTNQLYIKSSLLHILAVLSGYNMFTPTEKSHNKHVEDIKTILTYIKEHYREKIYIADLAREISLNEQYFCRFFKKAIGLSPIEYVNEYRIKQSLRLLEETDCPVMEICLECGYNNLGNFLREFRKRTNTTPLQYRKEKS
ncbi:MAG: AraC family transcriptional regulator [Eubacterium sp.]|nr:AraC family transcriptional regulator [Eubacterium sp.]